MNGALAKWRQWSGDDRFDDVLRRDAGGYVRFTLTQDEAALTRELAATARTLSVNWPMYTAEVRYTDRVLTFPGAWPRTHATGLDRPDHALLYSMVTGDPGAVEDFPLNGARWHTLPESIAVLVRDNRRDRFAAELFHFGTTERRLEVSLLALEPGRYRWTLSTPDARVVTGGEQAITAAAHRLALALPARALCRLTLEKLP